MSPSTDFTIGSDVVCSDGTCGQLRRVVVNPVARTLTHLVVEAKHRQGLGRLVPIDLVASSDVAIHLRCTKVEFESLEEAEETRYLPGARGQWAYGQDQMLSHPYYGLGIGGLGMGMGMVGGMSAGLSTGTDPEVITTDRVPAGEIEVQRGDAVYATDGHIGKIQGLVVNLNNHHVTHVLLDEGHLWGKKRVAVPIEVVTRIDDDVHVNLSKDEVGELPAVELADEP
ncbi:MAG TPA: PRC-barrel domain-containing protein [Acidimicrobiales bacterium]|nr:MAG: hypothetical protein B7X07_04240 [Actinobacteria bacterium 21-64-8]HQT99771.1 PRC-barrel domain-containing protein [Acidimicrobiales bacterium]